VLLPSFASGIGRLPIPVTHGMTVGELALMFNDVWLPPLQKVTPSTWDQSCVLNARQVKITVVACEGWERSMLYVNAVISRSAKL
jgi:uncharacterized protein YbbC (DUF1343 family)